MSRSADFLYDVKSFIESQGSIADKLRLHSAGFHLAPSVLEQAFTHLRTIINDDGGLPFALTRGNPSSVKETSEILVLLLDIRDRPQDIVDRMVSFLVSRQKGDGGFAETLNLRTLIEDRYGSSSTSEWYPVGKSITWLTGKALEALVLAGFKDEERISRGRDFLLYTQHEDGHWPAFKGAPVSDPLGTGNILPALRAVGINPEHRAYQSARAALFQHLKDSVNRSWTYDMVDLASIDEIKTDAERSVVDQGIALVIGTQNSDGGWSGAGSKKSDPELSSLLVLAVRRVSGLEQRSASTKKGKRK